MSVVKTEYEIRNAEGQLVAIHVRTDKPDGSKDVRWKLPNGQRGLNGTKLANLPLYGAEMVSDLGYEELIVLTEGEKARAALEAANIPAVGTVTGASSTPGLETLKVLERRRVCLWADNDDPGRFHMERIADKLYRVAAEVSLFTWHEAPEKGADAADHPDVLACSHKSTDRLRTELESAPRWKPASEASGPQTFTAADLMKLELPPVNWVVPDLLPEGITLLAGKPKLGKSWMALGISVAVSKGGFALGTKPVEQGRVLYLGLEDNQRRLQNRLRKILGNDAAPEALDLCTSWPSVDEGGAEALTDWIDKNPDARLIVVDVLKRIRPRTPRSQSIYDADYEGLGALHAIANEYGVAVLCVHHLRKAAAEDPMDEISGSTGLSGAADGVLLLKRDRGRGDAYLTVDGRDIEEAAELALTWNRDIASWTLAGDAEAFRLSQSRAEIIAVLEKCENPMTPTEVAEALGKSVNAIKQRLWQMSKDGQLQAHDGKYAVPDNHNRRNPHNRNPAESVTPVTGVMTLAEDYEDIPIC